ncbi:MAG: hypothetical protein JWP58_848 [Hymenobacter sp.]|nr:hypothetical protein [Hymenobacter sp.]
MAETLWDAKNTIGNGGKAAFAEIKQTLLGMCVGTELCNYCENNEATDVEHIYPKSFFPERAFTWLNYLLACKTCNTHFKLDQFAVFTPALSANATTMQRKKLPSSADAAFIDPRVEDPMDFLYLDITGKSFFLLPSLTLTNPRDTAKAKHTLSILQIGVRAALADARKAAFIFFQSRLERYQQVRDATTLADLERLIEDPDLVDTSNTFEAEQQQMLTGLQQSILRYSHPTVWREMQRQYLSLPKTKKLFEAVPEALGWK